MTNWIWLARIGSGVLAVALAGCGGNAAPDDAAGSEAAGASAAATSASPAAPAGTAPAREAGPASCGVLSLAEGASITAHDLADCLVDYLAFAGSGASEMTSETGSSRMVWRMGDEYEAYAELDSGVRMTSTGGAAWVDFGDTGWIKADPTVPGMEAAFGIVEAWREATAPEVGRLMIAAAPLWEVGPWGDVELPDGTSRNLAKVSAAAPFNWGGATVHAMTLWMEEPGRVILQQATAGAAGFTATSTTHFTQWGGEVEIPDPAAN
ncbi:hypothetical protein WCE37_05390 [Luteimonas sp. MJ250]|uniref:hypothetical protein n=1 Tax=Luteimonas sp. MJ250 TaxID=3129236 RepID=UPI0031B9D583